MYLILNYSMIFDVFLQIHVNWVLTTVATCEIMVLQARQSSQATKHKKEQNMINELFTDEWFSRQSKLVQKDFSLNDVKAALEKYAANQNRYNEIRTQMGKIPEPINWQHIANNVPVTEIISNYPDRSTRNLERWESKLQSHLSGE